MPGQPLDLRGQRFGLLLALEIERTANHRCIWRCRCDCGAIHYVRSSHLRSGRIQSCGCIGYRRNSEYHQIARAKVSPRKRRRIARMGAAASVAARRAAE